MYNITIHNTQRLCLVENVAKHSVLSTFNINNFNRETIIEMKNIKDLPNYIISLYKATVWKNRSLAQLREVNEQAVINSLDSTLRFYITHILKE